MITDYLNDLKTDGERLDNHNGDIAPATIFWFFRILRAMFNKAKEWNYLTHNPIDDIPKDKRPKPNYKVKPILEDDQLGTLLQKLFELKENGTNVKNQLFFYLALITGARSGEIRHGCRTVPREWTHALYTVTTSAWNCYASIRPTRRNGFATAR